MSSIHHQHDELQKKVTLFLTMLDNKTDGRLEGASLSMLKVIESLRLLTNYERLTPP